MLTIIRLHCNIDIIDYVICFCRDKVGKCEDKASLLQENLKLQDECVNEKNQEIDNLKKEIMVGIYFLDFQIIQ